MTVHDLRKSGYKVRILHFRVHDDRSLGEVFPKGGETVVQITTPDGQDLEGRAKCSNKERYNKRVGVQVAIGRALYSKCA
jgi:hypothetical protein